MKEVWIDWCHIDWTGIVNKDFTCTCTVIKIVNQIIGYWLFTKCDNITRWNKLQCVIIEKWMKSNQLVPDNSACECP